MIKEAVPEPTRAPQGPEQDEVSHDFVQDGPDPGMALHPSAYEQVEGTSTARSGAKPEPPTSTGVVKAGLLRAGPCSELRQPSTGEL